MRDLRDLALTRGGLSLNVEKCGLLLPECALNQVLKFELLFQRYLISALMAFVLLGARSAMQPS